VIISEYLAGGYKAPLRGILFFRRGAF